MSPSSMTLEPLEEADISAVVSLWYAAFHTPEMRKLFPDTPGVRQWWQENIRNDLRRKRAQQYLKVVERGQIIAYAKWDLASPEENGDRFLPWHPEMDSEACNQLAMQTASARKIVTGSRKHYYLDMLATHPAHQGKGAASLLLQWGCDKADQDQISLYVDASSDGWQLYRRFIFRDCSLPESDSMFVPMIVSEC
ncbi:acyl-CoA N-acyltransferase [Aspergillus similis]